MSNFNSLTLALEEWFDKSLSAMPDEVRQRIERDFNLMPWDSLSPEQRRSVALQKDYQHDPATEQERQYWWDFFCRKDALKKQIAEWETIATPTASDLVQKEARVEELKKELARMEQLERHAQGDYYPARKRLDGAGGEASTSEKPPTQYIAYPKAMKLLDERLSTNPEELAAWIFMGQKDGGLAAYTNANELNPPPLFNFGYSSGEVDYLAPLMFCWFREDDIANFQPVERYITGQALIDRWSKQPHIKPKDFIIAKIHESRLSDIHPTFGLTRGSSGDDSSPSIESGLFSLKEVADIEAADFGHDDTQVKLQTSPCQAVSASKISQHFAGIKSNPDENYTWWRKMMRNASDNGLKECRVGKGRTGPGGSLWRPDLIAAWLVERHGNGKDGMKCSTARAALKKFHGCHEVADEIFPPGE